MPGGSQAVEGMSEEEGARVFRFGRQGAQGVSWLERSGWPVKGIFLDFALIIVYGRLAIGVGCDPRLLSIEPAD